MELRVQMAVFYLQLVILFLHLLRGDTKLNTLFRLEGTVWAWLLSALKLKDNISEILAFALQSGFNLQAFLVPLGLNRLPGEGFLPSLGAGPFFPATGRNG